MTDSIQGSHSEEPVIAYEIPIGLAPRRISVDEIEERGVGGLVWIDVADAPWQAAVDQLASLTHLGLPRQWLAQAAIGREADDPAVADELGAEYDACVATDLAAGTEAMLVNVLEPVLVRTDESPHARVTFVGLDMSILMGPGCLVTWRRAAAVPLTPRATLEGIFATTQAGDGSFDLGIMLMRWAMHRAVRVAYELSAEIGRRALDVHRTVVRETAEPSDFISIVERLYDLRWSVDMLDLRLRALTSDLNPSMDRFYAASRDCDAVRPEITGMLARAVGLCTDGRRRLEEVSNWVASAQTAALLAAQVKSAERSDALQRLVAVVTVAFLGPTLVATIFGASPAWWDDHQELRAAMLGLFTILTMLTAGWALRDVATSAPDAATPMLRASVDEHGVLRGPEGNPIRRLPHRLGANVNRRIP